MNDSIKVWEDLVKISIVTICYNSALTIRRAIESVISQKNVNLEYIIVDGASKDNTVDIIKEYALDNTFIRWVSEKDNGIYDAMNKGIAMATGDIVGILNSDDMYANEDVLSTVCKTMEKTNLDSCFGNLIYIKTDKDNIRPYRYWKSSKLRSFKYGWMPPHPSFFVKREVYEKYGNFRLDCGTAADYELMLRLLEKNRISSTWINQIFVYMEAGGASGASLAAYKKSTKNDEDAWKINEMSPALGFKYLKKIRKFPQFIAAKFIKVR